MADKVDRRRANQNWNVTKEDGTPWDTFTYYKMQTALLLDIRDELRRVRAVLECPNATHIPVTLRSILRKMPTRRRKARTS